MGDPWLIAGDLDKPREQLGESVPIGRIPIAHCLAQEIGPESSTGTGKRAPPGVRHATLLSYAG